MKCCCVTAGWRGGWPGWQGAQSPSGPGREQQNISLSPPCQRVAHPGDLGADASAFYGLHVALCGGGPKWPSTLQQRRHETWINLRHLAWLASREHYQEASSFLKGLVPFESGKMLSLSPRCSPAREGFSGRLLSISPNVWWLPRAALSCILNAETWLLV